MKKFNLVSKYEPKGDQPNAIEYLTNGINNNEKEQILLGATGTGKTFTISNVIKNTNKKTLILAHNKTLAGQLYSEFKEFFPDNKVELFISYYDYYQPEAYVSSSDTYIEKDSKTNDDIDQLRHSTTANLLTSDDVIVIASVSCIYGIGDPEDYNDSIIVLAVGNSINRDEFLDKMVEMRYERNDIDFQRGSFRVRGDVVEVIPLYEKSNGIRIEFFDEEIERIREFDIVTGELIAEKKIVTLYPATHFVTNKENLDEAIKRIERELRVRLSELSSQNKLIEEQRLEQRTKYDVEMLKEIGSCSGVENYSRHLSLREEGSMPYTLMDFFKEDFLLVVDESHVTLPQVRGMYNGDRSRKQNLVDFGFRLPSAMDNRPLRFEEFQSKIKNVIYVSATPGDYELEKTDNVVEQIIRPTGLLDPVIEIRPLNTQVDDLLGEIKKRIKVNERILVTTLTIKMSEDLTAYLLEQGIKVTYLHSEIKSLERIEILHDLRVGKYDVLIGINLLREGLDLPEVSLVAILDADKEGFLRSKRSLLQTVGRAARNSNGRVIMYADKMTKSMQITIDETNRRRVIQKEYNTLHNITPTTINKDIRDVIKISGEILEKNTTKKIKDMNKKELKEFRNQLESEMNEAAKKLDFERAASIRDILLDL